MSSASHTRLEFLKLADGFDDCIAVLVLNRPESANAFSARMMEEISYHMDTVAHRQRCRLLLIAGSGKHFSGGADLQWMKEAAGLSQAQNVKESEKLLKMFEAISSLAIPKVAVVRGAVYGGAVGMVAACDFAIAEAKAKFCLSEARLGLIPAVIAPYLCRKMTLGSLKRLSLTGQVFSATEAQRVGLVEDVFEEPQLVGGVIDSVKQLLSCGPEAQISMNSLIEELRLTGFSQSDLTVSAIAKARAGSEAQSGLSAFFEKRPAPWSLPVPEKELSALLENPQRS